MSERPPRLDGRHRALLLVMAGCGALATGGVVLLLPVGVVLRVLLAVVAVVFWASLAAAVRVSVARPVRGLATVIEALRTGDYGVRGRGARPGEPMGELVLEVNRLADELRAARLKAVEATALIEQLVSTVDAAVLALDGRGVVRLANAAAGRLLERAPAELLGRSAAELGITDLVDDEGGTRLMEAVGGRPGRWQVTHGTFREAGMAQHLLAVNDLRRMLREEERVAWQRLLRVMGHEVKNSLAPIRSIAETVCRMLERGELDPRQRELALEGLRVVEARAGSLDRFLAQYRKLAHLPAPRPARADVAPLLHRVAALVPGQVRVQVDDALSAVADFDLLEQALVNLLRNAAEAAGPVGQVRLEAAGDPAGLTVRVMDDGPGIQNPENLFVPFFTTKPGGSGIGLVLSRQIAELHGGTLTLENRCDARGALATLRIPSQRR